MTTTTAPAPLEAILSTQPIVDSDKRCLQFNVSQLDLNLNMDSLMGKWYEQFHSKEGYKQGTCPIHYFKKYTVTKDDQNKKVMLKGIKDFNDYFTFAMRIVSKAAVGNFKRDVVFKGWKMPASTSKVNKNISTVWPGFRLKPAPYHSDNFQVLKLDEKFAIIYRCAEKYTPELMGKEQILVLTKDNFVDKANGLSDQKLQKDIEMAFIKLFGCERSFQSDMMMSN